jgi:hypothetical protein
MSKESSLKCPSCNEYLSKKTLNQLRYLVFGVRPAECESCSCKIQWVKETRDRIKFYGYLINLGIVLATYALIGRLGFVPSFGGQDHLVGISLLLVGLFLVSNRTKDSELELAKKRVLPGHPSKIIR